MTQVFEQGYDLRHGVAQSIPLLISYLLTMLSWSFKRRFYHDWAWKECIPSDKYKSYRHMQLINNGAFCLVDGADAYIRGAGNPVAIILRMNLIAWFHFLKLIFKELIKMYGRSYEDIAVDLEIVEQALEKELEILKSFDYAAWQEENERAAEFNRRLNLDDKEQVGNLAAEYCFISGTQLKYQNFDEFKSLIKNKKALW
jgi:hypothetical protein